MDRVILDASALLAMIQEEPGGNRVARLLLDPDQPVFMSTLNWSEVFDRLLRAGISEHAAERLLGRVGVETVDFDVEQARLAALYRISAPSLSLGDRACLALATIRNATAWTTDKLWARTKIAVKLEILR